jgi:hypothetical protein
MRGGVALVALAAFFAGSRVLGVLIRSVPGRGA